MRRLFRAAAAAALAAFFCAPASAQVGGNTAPSSPQLPYTAPAGQFVYGMAASGNFLSAVPGGGAAAMSSNASNSTAGALAALAAVATGCNAGTKIVAGDGSCSTTLPSGLSATNLTLVTPALGTPASGVATNLTGTATALTAGNVTTNANLTGPITSSGNATSVASQTGTGTKFVMDTSPTLVTPDIGTAIGASLVTTSTIRTTGAKVESVGASASLLFQARDLAQSWQWYATANKARLFNGMADVFSVDVNATASIVGIDNAINLGHWVGNTHYNAISLNGTLSATEGVTWYGGATGDNNSFFGVPTAGNYYFGVNNVAVTTISSSGINIISGDLYNNSVAPTGTGGYVRATSPTLVTPTLGVASGTSLAVGSSLTSGRIATFHAGTDQNINIFSYNGIVNIEALNDAAGANVQLGIRASNTKFLGTIEVPGVTTAALVSTGTFTSGAGASVGTLTNAPAAGNPTSWIKIVDNGVTRYIPAW